VNRYGVASSAPWFMVQIQVWLPSNPRLKDLVGTLHIGRLTLNKDIKSLEEALQNPASQMNLSRSNIPPTTPINSYGLGGNASGQQGGFCTPSGPAVEYYNPASARLVHGLSGTAGSSMGGGLDFRQPSFTPVPWENNSGLHQNPGGFSSTFDSSGPRVGLQLQGGPPRFGDVNYVEGSSDLQWSKSDFPWSRELVVRSFKLEFCMLIIQNRFGLSMISY
jgi:hypothetical protein